MKSATLLALAGIAVLAGCQSPSDVVVRQKTSTTGMVERETQSTQYWTSEMMIVDDDSNRIIIDFAGERLTAADKQKKTYNVVSFNQMRAAMDQARARMAQESGGLGPDAKAALSGMGEPIGAEGIVDVKPTGKREKIAGYDAEEYSFVGSAVSGTLWVSKDLPLPLGKKAKEAYIASTAGMRAPGRQFALAMVETNGIPLRTAMNVALGPNGTTTTNEVTEVRREPPPPEMRRVPEDFAPAAPAPPASVEPPNPAP